MARPVPRRRVLVVDDEPLICWSVAETLCERGDVVMEADCGDAAVRVLATTPEPDVVLLDYNLPDSHGLQLLSRLKAMAPHSHIILMSAYCTPEITRDALALGASSVVSKPIDMHDVPRLVERAACSGPPPAAGNTH